jgi:hypothetical protein
MSLLDQSFSPDGSSGPTAAIKVHSPPSYTAMYVQCSTLASTQSFEFQTAIESTGPWFVEGSTALAATNSVSAAAVLRLTGPYGYVRANLKTNSTGTYLIRILAV